MLTKAVQKFSKMLLRFQLVEIYVEYPNGKKYEGLAIITTADLDAPFGDACSYSFEFGGTGELTPVKPEME